MMADKSTTEDATNQDDQQVADNQTDSNASTDDQTADDSADLDTSKSTEESDADNKSNEDLDEDKTSPNFDTDLDEWAEKTGRQKPENDQERTLLQEIRDTRRSYDSGKDSKKIVDDFQKTIQDAKPDDNDKQEEDDDDVDPLEKRLDSYEDKLQNERNLRMRSEYFSEKGVTEVETKVMGEILKEKSDKGGQTAFDYWTNPDNLEDWHTLAQARIGSSTDNSQIKEQAARNERERIAKEHQANGSGRNASSVTSGEKTEEQKQLERFTDWD